MVEKHEAVLRNSDDIGRAVTVEPGDQSQSCLGFSRAGMEFQQCTWETIMIRHTVRLSQ